MKKIKNQNMFSGRKWKVWEMKVGLFFTKNDGKLFLSPFSFFSNTPFGPNLQGQKSLFSNFELKSWFFIHNGTQKTPPIQNIHFFVPDDMP